MPKVGTILARASSMPTTVDSWHGSCKGTVGTVLARCKDHARGVPPGLPVGTNFAKANRIQAEIGFLFFPKK